VNAHKCYVILILTVLFLFANNTNKTTITGNNRHSFFAVCFNNLLFPQKYSQLTHPIQSLTEVPFKFALPYMMCCAFDLVTPVCLSNTVLSVRYALLHPVLYGDNM